MADLINHLRRNLVQAEQIGQTERAKLLKARIAELEGASESVSKSMTKAELLAAADEAGVEVDDTMTKAEILEALEG